MPFSVSFSCPPQNLNNLREFLLVKLINGEKATFQTPTFSKKRERTLEMLIKDLYEEYLHDSKLVRKTRSSADGQWGGGCSTKDNDKVHSGGNWLLNENYLNTPSLSPVPLLRPSYQNMLNRRAFSEVLYDAPKASKLKEDARQVEFVRIGQALKLEAIVRGDAPTSLASTVPSSVFKRPPWEPHCFYANFLHRGNIVGDSWGKDALFIATDDGTFLIRGEWNRE